MSNVTFITVNDPDTNEAKEHVIIDRGNGEYTSMPKAVWDAQQEAAEQSRTL